MENFRTGTQRFGEGLGGDRLNHEFLNVDVVVGVLTAVQDVHHGNRHGVLTGGAVDFSNVLVQGDALVDGSGFGSGQGHGQDGVGAKLGLVLGAVGIDHDFVQRALIGGVFTHQQTFDGVVDVAHGLQYALAQVAGLVAVAQFQCFARTGRGARGGAGGAYGTAFQNDFSADGRVTATVQNFESFDVDNFTHA